LVGGDVCKGGGRGYSSSNLRKWDCWMILDLPTEGSPTKITFESEIERLFIEKN
jgi:hypothetical protein